MKEGESDGNWVFPHEGSLQLTFTWFGCSFKEIWDDTAKTFFDSRSMFSFSIYLSVL